MKDKLIELLGQVQESGFDYPADIERYTPRFPKNEEVADHLLVNGVIIPLCKVGDTVYHVNYTPYGGELYELEVVNISLQKKQPYYETEGIDFDNTAIGKSIFLSREDAKKALAARI